MKKRKFSLVELLVVVAIIGILARLLIPGLKKARDSARRASCMSNQKQIGITFAMYQDDGNGYFPVYGSRKDNVSWDDQLGIYDGRKLTQAQIELQQIGPNDGVNNSLYQCPSSVQTRDGNELKSYSIGSDFWYADISDDWAVRGTAGWTNLLDGEGNTVPDADGDNTTTGWSVNMNQIVDPNDFAVMMEVQNNQNLMGFARSMGVGYHVAGNITASYSPVNLQGDWAVAGGTSGFYVHDDRSFKLNILYSDGHVDFRNLPSTMGSWADNFYNGSWTGPWELQNSDDTQWNALD